MVCLGWMLGWCPQIEGIARKCCHCYEVMGFHDLYLISFDNIELNAEGWKKEKQESGGTVSSQGKAVADWIADRWKLIPRIDKVSHTRQVSISVVEAWLIGVSTLTSRTLIERPT